MSSKRGRMLIDFMGKDYVTSEQRDETGAEDRSSWKKRLSKTCQGTLKMREWKQRHGSAGVENAGAETSGKGLDHKSH